jgi:hypothetical protein
MQNDRLIEYAINLSDEIENSYYRDEVARIVNEPMPDLEALYDLVQVMSQIVNTEKHYV